MKYKMTRLLEILIFAACISPLVLYAADLPEMPSGPPGPGHFGASYANLKYSPEWDAPWRVGDHPDVVVRFEDGGHRLVFWRGTSYIPCWVSDAGVWYTNEFVERRGHHSPNTEGCVEPMSDKQCRYSHVRIIESNDARVVVHWRYAPVDVRYEHPFIDPNTGWSDWVDEYYTIYPDAVGVRKITVHTNQPDLWMEFQEAILLNQPGTMPDDNIELGAVSVCNMSGENVTYTWTKKGGPEFDGPPDANIMKINVKGNLKPFALVAPTEVEGRMITPYEGHGRKSHFNWWDHWPVSQDASDGRRAASADPPSHSSLAHIALHEPETWKDYARGEKWRTKIMMNGMTDKPVQGLLPLAKSWLTPPDLQIDGNAYTTSGYDPTQMAYLLANTVPDQPTPFTCILAASADSPIVNPALVIQGWGDVSANLELNGEAVMIGKDARIGHRYGLEGTDLVVWIRTESIDPVTITVTPDSG
jgi:hypothetical protein